MAWQRNFRKTFIKRSPKRVARTNLPKEKSLTTLKKELDVVFNAFIRKRDTIYDRGQPYFICISSGKPLPIDQMNAGHFHPAGNNEAIRWDERNVNGQSIHDNLYKHGNPTGYLKGMIKKYGQKVVDDLEIKRHNKSKMAKFEVSLLIQQYKQKLKDL